MSLHVGYICMYVYVSVTSLWHRDEVQRGNYGTVGLFHILPLCMNMSTLKLLVHIHLLYRDGKLRLGSGETCFA